MRTFLKLGERLLLAAIVFVFFLIFFEHRIVLPPWLMVVGRLHPVFLHFPIVLLLVFFCALWIPLRGPYAPGLRVLGLVASLTATATAITGYLLSAQSDIEGDLHDWHKWGGTFIALISSIFYYLHSIARKNKVMVRMASAIALAALTLTAHWGASMTHGENFLLEPIRTTQLKPIAVEEAIAFNHVIRPIFEEKCLSCHGGSKIKGGLSMRDSADMYSGGKNGPLFIPRFPDSSLMIHRINLPPGDKKRMPPKNKAQLTDDESMLLYSWIEAGAPIQQKVTDLPVTDTFRLLATNYLAAFHDGNLKQYEFPPADPDLIYSLNNNYRTVQPFAEGSPALAVSFFGRDQYSQQVLKELLPLKEQIVSLNLNKIPVKDGDLSLISQFVNLRTLNLNYSEVTSDGIAELRNLTNLESVTLAGTDVNSNAIQSLLQLPKLRNMYIWETKVDTLALAGFRNSHKSVNIHTGFDEGNDIVAVSAPIVYSDSIFFSDSVRVSIKHAMRDVEIRYTTDGTEPDSLHSKRYTGAIWVKATSKISAKVFKKGWYSSKIAEAVVVKRGLRPEKVILYTNPPLNFLAKPGSILVDEDVADVNRGSGKWFGYTKPATIMLEYDTSVTISNVWMNFLYDTDFNMMIPSSIEIWGGSDSTSLRKLGESNPGYQGKTEYAKMMQESFDFRQTTVKFVKVIMQTPKTEKGKDGSFFISEMVFK